MSEVSDAEILAAFLRVDDAFVSGTAIAEDTGLSRVAIKGRLDRLREQGFDFEAVRNKGYRLETIPGYLHPSLLAAYLLEMNAPVNIHYFEETDSTNTQANRLLAEGEETPFVVIAGRQTAGRGRRGREWYSADAGNLYLSLALRPQLTPARMQRFTLWMGLATCLAIKEICNIELRLKWPNDLHWQGKKVAGMLTEARSDSEHLIELVFGIGLNVNGVTDEFPPEVRAVASSLREAAGGGAAGGFEINIIAAALMSRLVEATEAYLDGSYGDIFEQQWPQYDALVGKAVTIEQAEGEIAGQYAGIDASGRVLLRLDSGEIKAFSAGDVTIKKQ